MSKATSFASPVGSTSLEGNLSSFNILLSRKYQELSTHVTKINFSKFYVMSCNLIQYNTLLLLLFTTRKSELLVHITFLIDIQL